MVLLLLLLLELPMTLGAINFVYVAAAAAADFVVQFWFCFLGNDCCRHADEMKLKVLRRADGDHQQLKR